MYLASRKTWFFWLRMLLVAMVLASAASVAQAQSIGRLLFLNPSTGATLVGGIDQLGQFHKYASGIRTPLIGKSVLVPTADGILAYSPSADGQIVRIDGVGYPTFSNIINLSPGWKQIVSFGDHLFFYNGGNGGAIVVVNSNGSVLQTQTIPNLSVWSQIIPTNNYLTFYQKNTGNYAVAVISYQEVLVSINYGTIGKSYTLFGAVGDDTMPYDPTTGSYEIDAIKYSGNNSDNISVRSNGKILPGFNSVVESNGYLFWYNILNGRIVIGYIDKTLPTGGVWKQTQSAIASISWSSVLTAGQFILFYNKSSGSLAVGYISPQGQFVQTYAANIDPSYSSVAATTR